MDSYMESWVKQAIANEDFSSYELKLAGGAPNGLGYSSQMHFVKVCGVTKNGQPKQLNLLLKHSSDNAAFRKNLGEVAFHQEIIAYQDVFPVFEEFQRQKKIRTPFKAYAKCYKCLKLNNKEVLVLEDLKSAGYELHERYTCMNPAHIRTVLREYAKLHALSFALQDQNKQLFDSLTPHMKDPVTDFASTSKAAFNTGVQDVLDLMRRHGHEDLYLKYKQQSEGGADRLVDILETIDDKAVIVHGDSWNNNFMFHYENNDKSSPTSVMIVDWQQSTLKSPAYDLAYFLYMTSTKSAHLFPQYLQEYHQYLSDFLIQLGSSPNLYTFEDLQRHWKKFQIMALLFIPTAFKFVMVDKDNMPDFTYMEEGKNMGDYLNLVPAPKNIEYYERLKCAIEYTDV